MVFSVSEPSLERACQLIPSMFVRHHHDRQCGEKIEITATRILLQKCLCLFARPPPRRRGMRAMTKVQVQSDSCVLVSFRNRISMPPIELQGLKLKRWSTAGYTVTHSTRTRIRSAARVIAAVNVYCLLVIML